MAVAVLAWVPVGQGTRTYKPVGDATPTQPAMIGDATPIPDAHPVLQDDGAEALLGTCALDVVNADLRVVWGSVSKAAKAIRTPMAPPFPQGLPAPSLPPFPLELGAACARHFFLALDELGDKLVRTATAKRLRVTSSRFSWTARVCQQVSDVRSEAAALFSTTGRGPQSSQCAEWRRVSSTLQLSLLTSCMGSVAVKWWNEVANPLWTFCSAERFRPSEEAVSRVVPQLAVAASVLLPRLKPQLDNARKRCAEGSVSMSVYELRSCRGLLAATTEEGPAPMNAQGVVSSLLPDVQILKWRVSALASDEWSEKLQAAPAKRRGLPMTFSPAEPQLSKLSTLGVVAQLHSVSSDDGEVVGIHAPHRIDDDSGTAHAAGGP